MHWRLLPQPVRLSHLTHPLAPMLLKFTDCGEYIAGISIHADLTIQNKSLTEQSARLLFCVSIISKIICKFVQLFSLFLSPFITELCLTYETPQKTTLNIKNLNDMEDILVPIFICVVLPVAIVAIVFAATMNNDNKRAKVLIKAIESNCAIDTDKLAEALQKPKKSIREILNLRLLRGCIFSSIGVVLCIVAIVVRCMHPYSDDPVLFFSMSGGISIAIGLSYLVVYFVTRKQIKD